MSDKKSFILHNDIASTLEEYDNEEKGILFQAIVDYHNGLYDHEKSEKWLRRAMKPLINLFKIDEEKYKKTVERNRKNGKKGGRPKKNPEKPSGFSENPKEPKKPDNGNVNDNDSVNDNDNDNAKDNNTIPNKQDVIEWAEGYADKHNKDKQQCVDLALKGWSNYKENGWKDVNDKPVKRWKIKLSNSYLSLDKLRPAIDVELKQYERSLTYLLQGNRRFEETDYCLLAYNSGEASPTEQQHLETVLKYRKAI